MTSLSFPPAETIQRRRFNLTERQIDVLVAIRKYRHLHGYAPTFQELADKLGISKPTIFEHVEALKAFGVLTGGRLHRSLEIAEEWNNDADGHEWKLPVLGSMSSGSPIAPIPGCEEIDLATIFGTGNRAFRIKGDGFASEHLKDGDYVVVKLATTAPLGERVLALVHSCVQIGRLYHDGLNIRLVSEDGTQRVFPRENVAIKGVITGAIRRTE